MRKLPIGETEYYITIANAVREFARNVLERDDNHELARDMFAYARDIDRLVATHGRRS